MWQQEYCSESCECFILVLSKQDYIKVECPLATYGWARSRSVGGHIALVMWFETPWGVYRVTFKRRLSAGCVPVRPSLRRDTSVKIHRVRCSYNVVNFLQNLYKRRTHSSPIRVKYGVFFYGLKLWFIFCPSHCSDVCNIILYRVALQRHPTERIHLIPPDMEHETTCAHFHRISSTTYQTRAYEYFYGWRVSFQGFKRPVTQIPQCPSPTSHNAQFCNRKVHMCIHFCYKMVHCGIFVKWIVGFGRWFYSRSGMASFRQISRNFEIASEIGWWNNR